MIAYSKTSAIEIGAPSLERISVEGVGLPSNLGDALSAGVTGLSSDSLVFLPAGGTTSLRVPVGALDGARSAKLAAEADMLAITIQAALLGDC